MAVGQMSRTRPLVPTSSLVVPDEPPSPSSLVPLPKGGRGRGTEQRSHRRLTLVPRPANPGAGVEMSASAFGFLGQAEGLHSELFSVVGRQFLLVCPVQVPGVANAFGTNRIGLDRLVARGNVH